MLYPTIAHPGKLERKTIIGSAESMEGFRRAIDHPYDDTTKERQNYYINLSKEVLGSLYSKGWISFDFEELGNYLDDWFIRDIPEVEQFIGQAISNDCSAFEYYYKNYHPVVVNKEHSKVELIADKVKSIEKLIADRRQINPAQPIEFEKEDLQPITREKGDYYLRYLGLENDPDQFIYNFKDAEQYINDWLVGVDTAEEFVIRAMKEDTRKFMLLVERRFPEERERLLNLISKYVGIDEIKLISAIRFRDALFANSTDTKELARILNEICGMELILEVFSPENKVLRNLILSSTDVFPLTEDPITILMYLLDDPTEASRMFFRSALRISDPEILPSCISKLEYQKQIKHQENLKAEKNVPIGNRAVIKHDDMKKEITLDYYMASLKKDIKTLLDLALMENPKLFVQLFTKELTDLCGSYEGKETIRSREGFYRELMDHRDMKSVGLYKNCLSQVNKAFAATGLSE